MISRNLHGLAVSDQVAARIANMGNGDAIKPQYAGDHRGGHPRGSTASRQGRFKYVPIGLLNQAGEQSSVRLSIFCFRETSNHAFHSSFGRYFPLFMSADSISQDE
jgi:hypothetical protein